MTFRGRPQALFARASWLDGSNYRGRVRDDPEFEPPPDPGAEVEASPSEGTLLTSAELDAMFERPARPRLRMTVGAGVVIALVALAVALVVAALQPGPASIVGPPDAASSSGRPSSTAAASGALISGGGGTPTPSAGAFVHVLGAVARPGVFQLAAGARVVDAIAAAGGLLPEADPGAVNLARPVVDGEQLYVPRLGESPPAAPVQPSAAPGAGGQGSTGGTGGTGTGLVNLNTASQSELETLPRVGPALAGRIIDYRTQHGGFTSVDDLKEVSGIGEATFAAIAPHVTV